MPIATKAGSHAVRCLIFDQGDEALAAVICYRGPPESLRRIASLAFDVLYLYTIDVAGRSTAADFGSCNE